MLGRSIGISDDEMAAMAEAQTSPLFDATDRLVLRYAQILTRENRVSDELYAELAARFPQDELVELCFTVGLAALVNRVHATFRTDVDSLTLSMVGDVAFCPIGR
jgi:alkylhydroperoxidase family enzyme